MPYLAVKDGTKIYYEEQGKGETILFLHGLNSSSLFIRDFINQFKDKYHCVYYDHRGHKLSEQSTIHMNIDTLASDMRELIEYLDLNNITVIGHSMGAGTIFRYVNKFGCDRIKNIVAVDMSPYMRNTVWKGGINQGNWSDEDFFCDLDRYFDNVGLGNWYIVQNAMIPAMKTMPKNLDNTFISAYSNGSNVFTAVSLWWSLFRTDSREAIKKITVPFLYIMPETPLYSMVTVDFYKQNVKSKFVLEKNFPNTTHMILMEQPKMVADSVKRFLNS